jgi:phospholipase C
VIARTRRLAALGAATLAAMILVLVTPPVPQATAGAPDADQLSTTTPIKHFVTLMQENHTFDSYFGTYPGADGVPPGTCMPSGTPGKCVKPWHIGGTAIEDLGHNLETFRRQYDHGKMDGFITTFADARMQNPDLPMGYYDRRDIPFYWNVADNFVLFDHNFTSAHAGSVANHMYWVTGTPGGQTETIPKDGFTAPTIFDRLMKAGISWKFYVENYDPTITFRSRGTSDRGSQVIWCPLLAYARYVDDPALNRHIVPIDEYYRDLEHGTLPAVSYIVPSGSSEHPPGSIQAGEAYVSNLISGLMRSSAWSSSAFMWTYDDWGGFYDHVKPPKVDKFGYGFRAPALLVSAYARHGFIDHTPIDFTSQLRFIEDNWRLKPLASRDRDANSLSSAFDFKAPPRPAKFVSPDYAPAKVVVTGQGVVYLSYGTGLLLGAGVSIGAVLHMRRRPPRPRAVTER